MKKAHIFVQCGMVLLFHQAVGQQIDFTPYPGYITHCPGELVTYTSSTQASGCGTRTWTITNGVFVLSNGTSTTTTGTSVDVRWNDVASTGKLKISVTCGTETYVEEKTYAIRSLTARTPANALAYQTLPYCGVNTIRLRVDPMLLLNTGGSTGIPQQYANGYEWVLPSGWLNNGTSGTIRTQEEFIDIYPDNGCRGGSVSVKAYVNCSSGRKYSSAASISVNRPTQTITVTPSAGYSGPSCGSVQPVTFTATPVSCASTYTWVFNGPDANTPTGWLSTPGPVVTNTNYITVTPSGGARDAGSIQVTANLDCGVQLSGTVYKLTFSPPVISTPSSICDGGTQVTLNNVASSVNVNWITSANMSIVSGQGTREAIIKAINATLQEQGTIDAVVSCPNTTVPRKDIWVGKPFSPYINGPQTVLQNNYYVYSTVPAGPHPTFEIQGVSLATGFQWSFPLRPSGRSWRCYSSCSTYSPTILPGNASTYVSVQALNNCGSSVRRDYEVFVQQDNCPPGGCEEPFFVSPNPVSQVLTITVPNELERLNVGTTQIVLTNFQGQPVYTINTSDSSVYIPVNDLQNGIYYLTISKNSTLSQRQIVISH